MNRYRLLGFGLLFGVTAFVYGAIDDAGGVQRVGFVWQVAMTVLAVIWVVMICGDVAYHAMKREGQACRHCGHLRKMASFRLSPVCPKCGQ